jgi:hypothetical protein
MGLKSIIKSVPYLYTSLFWILKRISYFDARFHLNYKNYTPSKQWLSRTQIVVSSPDNKKIPRVEDAGKIYNKYQVMQNGLRINLGSYYNCDNAFLLEKNYGVHEPQEEYVFQEVLKVMPEGATMLELGSYWAFYSMWFASNSSSGTCWMVEPDTYKLLQGIWNFRLNKLKGTFIQAFIGKTVAKRHQVPIMTVDHIMSDNDISFIDILHSDIQGFELEMLHGAIRALTNRTIGYVFISTHTNKIHQECLEYLHANKYVLVCEADLEASYSLDGLIVAKSPSYEPTAEVSIVKRQKGVID